MISESCARALNLESMVSPKFTASELLCVQCAMSSESACFSTCNFDLASRCKCKQNYVFKMVLCLALCLRVQYFAYINQTSIMMSAPLGELFNVIPFCAAFSLLSLCESCSHISVNARTQC